MGLSETIIAAIIGALATMGTAIFQLVRNSSPTDGRPKPKKSRMRSLFATIALMIGCLVGGYAWSALRAVSAKEELQATMQAEFSRQFAEFAERQKPTNSAANAAAMPAGNADSGASESLAQLPACRISAQSQDAGPVTCNEASVQSISLCAAIPARAEATNVRVLSRVPKSEAPWEERAAGAATLGSLHIGATPTQSPITPDLHSVCLDVANYSVEETLTVRLVVEYAVPKPQTGELTASAPTGHAL
jgi:hypothetical protein